MDRMITNYRTENTAVIQSTEEIQVLSEGEVVAARHLQLLNRFEAKRRPHLSTPVVTSVDEAPSKFSMVMLPPHEK